MHRKSRTSYNGNVQKCIENAGRNQRALEATFMDDTSANDEMNEEPSLVTGKSLDGTAP